MRCRILLDPHQNLAGLLECLKLWAISRHFRFLLQFRSHLLIEFIEVIYTFDQGLVWLPCHSRQHFFEQFESGDCVLQLLQFIGQLVKVFEQGRYDTLELRLYLLVQVMVVPDSVVLLAHLVLFEEVVESTHDKLYRFDLEVIFTVVQATNLLLKQLAQGLPD